ncbi:MAG: alpha/beta hydrolase [Chitinophagaceae bacterium]
MNYRIAGNGPVVVLVHGFAEDGSVYDAQVERLGDEFTVFVIDLPGCGKSGLIGNGTETDHASTELMAEAVYEILKSGSVDSCTIIGHSMGGYVSLAFAEKYPELLKGLGLFHSSAFADTSEKIETRLKAIDHLNKYGTKSFLLTSIPNLFAEKFKKNNPGAVEQFIKKYTSFTPASLTGYYYAMINRPDRTHVLRDYAKPILFIIGEEDMAIPLPASLNQCYLPKQSHLHILPSTGHMGMIEEPAKTSTILLDFCRITSTIQP